jgi:hypothetical protein
MMPTLNELRNSPPTFDRALAARQGITARLLRRPPLDRASAHQVQGLYHRFFWGHMDHVPASDDEVDAELARARGS